MKLLESDHYMYRTSTTDIQLSESIPSKMDASKFRKQKLLCRIYFIVIAPKFDGKFLSHPQIILQVPTDHTVSVFFKLCHKLLEILG